MHVRPTCSPKPRLSPGEVLGHYRILEKIGEGGMGEVYCARDEHLGREVAIKVLPAGILATDHARSHFRKEAEALSKLNHPNIAIVHDFDRQGEVDFLVMEYIPGIALDQKLSAGPLAEKDILRLGIQLAEGLSAAHEHGVVHCDLKPANLQLGNDGRLKILDFGLAKLLGPAMGTPVTLSSTEAGVAAGTLLYMAPEQVLGQQIDARTDIHAAGAVLYEMATGHCPFVEGPQLISAILRSCPLRPTALNPTLSAELERIIAKCMEKDPEDRYQSVMELAVDLRRLRRDTESAYIPADSLPRARQRGHSVRLWKPVAAAALLTIVLLLAALWFAWTKKTPTIARGTPTIAVLPFVDLSPTKDQEYFSDGLAEELLNSLAKIQGLRVAARTSSFQFKGKNEDLRVIGQKLNVGTLLEGSVRKQGQRVRISAQLIQVSDGFHLWSEAYDRDLTDIFAVQEEIARSVAQSLKLKLLGQTGASPRATKIEAYNAYLQAKYFYGRPTRENLERAITYSEQAIALDSGYAPAWAVLARARIVRAGAYGPLQEYSKAREAAERALSLDHNVAEAHVAIGTIKQTYDWDWTGADASYQQALLLEPGNSEVVEGARSLAATLNRFEEALSLSRRAVDLDPLRASAHQALAFNAWWAGRLDEAEAAARKGLEIDPQYPWLHTVLGRVYLAKSHPAQALAEAETDTAPAFREQGLALAYHVLGRKQDSDRALRELIAKYQQLAAFQIAEVYAFRGEADAAFMWLDRAYSQRDSGLTYIKGDPLFKNLARDPRYAAVLSKMGLLAKLPSLVQMAAMSATGRNIPMSKFQNKGGMYVRPFPRTDNHARQKTRAQQGNQGSNHPHIPTAQRFL